MLLGSEAIESFAQITASLTLSPVYTNEQRCGWEQTTKRLALLDLEFGSYNNWKCLFFTKNITVIDIHTFLFFKVFEAVKINRVFGIIGNGFISPIA